MSSILTNNSAMVALQTLKSINMNLGKVQSEISTGKTVESAKDNAAVWAISKVMSSDVEGFKAISDSLSLGQATVGVALNASESVTDLLTEIKGKIVAAQESNVDRAKIQTDIGALTDQVSSILGAAQFNGLNLLNGSSTKSVEVLSSLDRAADGSVSSSSISVDRTNLTTSKAVLADTTVVAGGINGGAGATGAIGADSSAAMTVVSGDGTAAGEDVDGIAFTLNFTGATGEYGDSANEINYVAQQGDTGADIASGLVLAYEAYALENDIPLTGDNALSVSANGDQLTVTTNGTGNDINANVAVNAADTGENVSGGKLAALDSIDVSTEEGANNALAAIENLIQASIDTAAGLGSSGRQIDTQNDFVGKLTDLLTSGIGTLVDADMEAASAKLQALQTQQQLGVQALSIANQAPQTILSLFR